MRLEEDAGRARDELLAVLHDLARDGPTQDELDTYRREILGDYYDAPWLLERSGLDELLGRPPSDRREDVIALTSRSVADALGAALETRIVLAPESLAPADGYHDGDDVAVEPVKGRVHRAREGDAQLTVGPEGVTWDDVTSRFESIVAVVRGASGALLLIGRDRSWMELAEEDWEDGAELLAAVAASLPDGIVIPAPCR